MSDSSSFKEALVGLVGAAIILSILGYFFMSSEISTDSYDKLEGWVVTAPVEVGEKIKAMINEKGKISEWDFYQIGKFKDDAELKEAKDKVLDAESIKKFQAALKEYIQQADENRDEFFARIGSFSMLVMSQALQEIGGPASYPKVRDVQLSWSREEWQALLDKVQKAAPDRSKEELTRDRAYAQAHLIASYLSRKHGMLMEFKDYDNAITLGFRDKEKVTFTFKNLEERWLNNELLKTDEYTIAIKPYE